MSPEPVSVAVPATTVQTTVPVMPPRRCAVSTIEAGSLAPAEVTLKTWLVVDSWIASAE